MNISRALIAGSLLLVFSSSLARTAPEQEMSVVSGCGGWSSNATVRTACVAGQSGTTGVSGNGRYTHYAGFMGGAFIRPGVTNADGVVLELDPDNDDDGLTDQDEVSGSAFSGHASTDPNKADTDGDGMDDAAEAAGMYDPNDAGHSLAIVVLEKDGASLTLKWVGKGGGTENTVLWCDDLLVEPTTNVLHSAPYAGGVSPWFKSTNEHTWIESAAPSRYFRVMTE